MTDPIQYMNMRNQAELNEGKLTVTYNRDDILEYEEGMKHDKYIYPASDWYDLCYQNGFLQQYNARVSGGTDKISYSLGGGYMNQRGIMVANDDAERFSWDMKINAQVTKRLKVGISLLGNLRYNTDPIYGVSTTVNVINRALPIFGTQLPDGKWLSTWLSTPGRNNPENPLMELHEGNTKRQLHRILGRINIGYDLPWGIKYNANLGYVKVDHYSKDFKHAMYTYNPKTLERKNFSAYVSAKDWDNNAINYTFYNTLSWGKSFGGNHNFNVMVGTEYKRYDGKNFQAKKRDYFNNQLTALSVGSTMEDISGGSSLELLFSYFGRITYDYKEKYLIDVTARYDGSSKFAKGNRWAFFPAVSVGWRIDKENFMQNVRAVDVLKLRGSVGEMGNQAIGNYEYLMAVLANKSYNYSFGDVLSGGAAIKDFVDENISWETTRTYNLGLDFEAFDHRLLFSVDLYKKRTEGILRDVKIPAQIGNLNGPKQNIGVVANDGVELNLQWRSAVKNFHYSLGGNFCYNKNIVVDLDGQEYIKTFNIIREGEPIDAWYLYQADGFYNSYEEIANSVTVGSGVKPGYIRYKNLNNDDKIDNDDRAVCGNLTPSITYAFNFSLGWKGLELSAQFQGVADVKTYLSGNLAAPFWNGAGVLKEWATDAWTPENHNSRLPILHTATGRARDARLQEHAVALRCVVPALQAAATLVHPPQEVDFEARNEPVPDLRQRREPLHDLPAEDVRPRDRPFVDQPDAVSFAADDQLRLQHYFLIASNTEKHEKNSNRIDALRCGGAGLLQPRHHSHRQIYGRDVLGNRRRNRGRHDRLLQHTDQQRAVRRLGAAARRDLHAQRL